MEYIKFILTESNSYRYADASGAKICLLVRLLLGDVIQFFPSHKKWIRDENSSSLGGNITTVWKEGNMVVLSDLLSEQADGGPFLEIPKEEFKKLLDEWERVCKEQPKEVMIINEGDTYSIEIMH